MFRFREECCEFTRTALCEIAFAGKTPSSRGETDMNPKHATTIVLSTAAPLFLAGCNPAVKNTIPKVDSIASLPMTEMTCPVTGETVTELDEAAYFESYPVYCSGRANARQFASLESSQRARFAADQVLAQKGIANKTCPLTGEPLTATSAAVVFDGATIGFATPADANQFRSLKPERQSKLIADWKASGSA